MLIVTRNGNMLYMDEHDVPMPLDYFEWVIKNDKRTYIVDTGFGEVASKKRATPLLRTPAEGPALIGVNTAEVENVITVSYTHLRAHETPEHLVCRLLLEKKNINHRFSSLAL